MKIKAIIMVLVPVLFFCGCGMQTTMDLEYLQEEAFQKGYEQGRADAEIEAFGAEDYDSAYSAGYEEGFAAGYSEGAAASENKEAKENPENSESSGSASQSDDTVFDYVLNENSKKFHKPDCSSVGDIKEKNKGYFTGTREEILAKGYEPCGRCNP